MSDVGDGSVSGHEWVDFMACLASDRDIAGRLQFTYTRFSCPIINVAVGDSCSGSVQAYCVNNYYC
jgi:hypothetical protein